MAEPLGGSLRLAESEGIYRNPDIYENQKI